jgi:hypothetical protein
MIYKRKIMPSTVVIKAAIEDVFPLLCPERERDWLPGWDYEMVHSNSGLIELGCIFKNSMDEKNVTWICTTYDKKDYEIYFVQYFNSVMVGELGISLSMVDEKITRMEIINTRTALNEEGNKFVEEHSEKDMTEFWNKAGKMIEYYLENGKMIELKNLL